MLCDAGRVDDRRFGSVFHGLAPGAIQQKSQLVNRCGGLPRLLRHFFGGRGGLLSAHGVGLSDRVDLLNAGVDLRDALRLLIGCVGDFVNERTASRI